MMILLNWIEYRWINIVIAIDEQRNRNRIYSIRNIWKALGNGVHHDQKSGNGINWYWHTVSHHWIRKYFYRFYYLWSMTCGQWFPFLINSRFEKFYSWYNRIIIAQCIRFDLMKLTLSLHSTHFRFQEQTVKRWTYYFIHALLAFSFPFIFRSFMCRWTGY